MSLFKQKEKIIEDKIVNIDLGNVKTNSAKKKANFNAGVRTRKDFIAPSAISMVNPRTMLVGDNYVRNFVMFGYPSTSYVGWLHYLYNHQGNADVTVKFEPIDSRAAVDTLTQQISAYQSQLAIEQEKGKITNVTKYQAQIEKLVQQRVLIEQNISNLLQCTIYLNLMNKSLDDLEREANLLENRIKGQRMDLMATELQMFEGYKACLPSLPEGLKDKKRNFDTSAAVGCIPFYDNELSDPNGIFMGVNMSTGTPSYIDFFNEKSGKVENSSITVFGRAGSGKSYLVSSIILRSSMKGVLTAIVDPEGEFLNITEALGGKVIKIGSNDINGASINIFDIDEEERYDDNGQPTGIFEVNISDKIADIISVIGVMTKGTLNGEEESAISTILQKLYRSYGISADPKSLYNTEKRYDPVTKSYQNSGTKKPMPQFSDFFKLLSEESKKNSRLEKVTEELRMFTKDGIYGMFDCQSNLNLGDLKKIPVLDFNISALDSTSDTLRPIGMQIVSSFIWDKFAKKLPGIKKRVVVDEAWMMLNQNMSGHEFTAKFLEQLARRIRKRKGGLLVASQNLSEFMSSSSGQVVVANSPYNIFLTQSESDLEKVQDLCKLTDGERSFIAQAQIGDLLLKTEHGSSAIRGLTFPFEHELLTRRKW